MPKPVYKSTSTANDQAESPGRESRNGQIKSSEIVPIRALRDEPDLIAAIQKDIKGLGVVGEKDAALLLYLVGTSRLLASPMRAIFRGPSGSGKSEIQQRVASMFPVEDVIEATSLTTNALYYMDEGELENKFIVKGERSHRRDDDQADVTAALRQLISEGRIVKLVTAMVDGQLSTKKITQNGPIAFCETTTQEKLLSEDVNRCLMIRTDDSEPQTAKVMQATAQAFLPGPIARDPQAIIDRHREFQSSLESRSVVVPYAVDLAKLIPSGKVEARRVIRV